MRNPQHKQSPLATSERFRRPDRPETPYSADVSPGRRSRQRTTSAENRTKAQDPRQNQHPFPAKPSRTRGGAPAGEAAAAVSADAGATRGIAANTPPSPVRLGQRARGILLQDAQARAGERQGLQDEGGAKQAVFKYIELCCNTRKVHSSIGYNAPCDPKRDAA